MIDRGKKQMQEAYANRVMDRHGSGLDRILSTHLDIGLPSDRILSETLDVMKRPDEYFGILIPSTYEDAIDKRTGKLKEPLRNLLDVCNSLNIKTHGNIDILLGLDTADTAFKHHNILRQTGHVTNLEVQHNSSAEMKEMREKFGKKYKVSLENGKGTNVHLMFQNLHKRGHDYNVIVIDADIVPRYLSEREVLSIVTGLVHPLLEGDFSKVHYRRETSDGYGGLKLAGRVQRLLVDPIIDAMKLNFSSANTLAAAYLEFFSRFPYKLSGEIGISSRRHGSSEKNFSDMPLLKGWPLEVGTIDYQFRSALEAPIIGGEPQYAVRHVKWRGFDHDHGSQGKMDEMAGGITRSRFETLLGLGVRDMLKRGSINRLIEDYTKIALGYVNMYAKISMAEGLSYDMKKETESVESFAGEIRKAHSDFLKQPFSRNLIPSCSEAPMYSIENLIDEAGLRPGILMDPMHTFRDSEMYAYA